MCRNEFVDFINGFYSQNISQDSSYSELSKTMLKGINLKATNVIDDIETGKISVLILTGNAGDGKTHLCAQIYEKLTNRTFQNQPVVKEKYIGKELIIIKDASELEQELLMGYCKDINSSLQNETKPKIFILAGNEGRLSETFIGMKELYEPFKYALEKQDIDKTKAKSLEIINFNFRSLTEENAFSSIIDSFIQPENWVMKDCKDCIKNNYCSIWLNTKLLQKEIVQKSLRELFRLIHIVTGHFSLRELLSAIAFTITANKNCDEIKEKNQSHLFYNNIFSKHIKGFIQEDRLLKQLSLYDIALAPKPKINRIVNKYSGENIEKKLKGIDLIALKTLENQLDLLLTIKRRLFFLHDEDSWGNDWDKLKTNDVVSFFPLDSYIDFLKILKNREMDISIIPISLNVLGNNLDERDDPELKIFHPFQNSMQKFRFDLFPETEIKYNDSSDSKYLEVLSDNFIYMVEIENNSNVEMVIDFYMFQTLSHIFKGNMCIQEYQKQSFKIEDFRRKLFYTIEQVRKKNEIKSSYFIENNRLFLKKDKIIFREG